MTLLHCILEKIATIYAVLGTILKKMLCITFSIKPQYHVIMSQIGGKLEVEARFRYLQYLTCGCMVVEA